MRPCVRQNQHGESIWRACLRRLSVFLVERHPRFDAHHVVEGCSWQLTTGRLVLKCREADALEVASEAGTSEWVPSTEGESTTIIKEARQGSQWTQVHILQRVDWNSSGDVAFYISLYIIYCLSKVETTMVGSHKGW